jgi:hypothetical protein
MSFCQLSLFLFGSFFPSSFARMPGGDRFRTHSISDWLLTVLSLLEPVPGRRAAAAIMAALAYNGKGLGFLEGRFRHLRS